MEQANTVVIGASDNPERTSYLAVQRLLAAGHRVFPVNPKLHDISGQKVFASISDIAEPVDTVSVYLRAEKSSVMADEIISASPRRIIFNPGAENPELEEAARAKGIITENACTLVLLSIGRF
ncbi:CoA-binding protein [Fibrobacterota bacterium]